MITKHTSLLRTVGILAILSAIGGAWTRVAVESPLLAQQPSELSPLPAAKDSNTSVPRPAVAAPVVEFYGTGNFQNRAWGPNNAYATVYVAGPDANDPEMAKLAETEGELTREAEELLSQYAGSDDAAEQKKLKADLRQALAKQFDVQKQRRELELARIEERVRKLREQLKKRTDARETIVDRRLEQLVNDAEGLGWTPGAAGLHDGQQIRVYQSVPGRVPSAK